MSPTKTSKKIVWAVNAYSADDASEMHALQTIKYFAQALNATIEPVTVCQIIQDEKMSLDFLDKLEKRLENVSLPQLQKPRLISLSNTTYSSVRLQVNALLDYAKASQADLVAVQLRQKKGKPELFMGSFAETLTLSSSLPILTINPNYPTKKNFRKILLATDFSQESQNAFSQVLGLAKKLDAHLDIFHWIEHPSVYHYGFYGMYFYKLKEFLDRELEKGKEQSAKLIKSAEDVGVKAKAIVKVGKHVTYEGILKEVKASESDLIAMATQTGQPASLLLGSTTRQVIRHAHCPVWAIHPK